LSELLWSESAARFLLTLAPEDEESIIEAVSLFAETGRGFVRTMLGTSERRLYIPGYAITFHVEQQTIFVLRISSVRLA
jgi:hypothetical protein